MISNKTRFSAAERRNLVLRGYIKPSQTIAVMPLTVEENTELRKKGRLACSRANAILSRRRELNMVYQHG